MDKKKCRAILRYVDQTTKHFWVALLSSITHNFNMFKAKIFKQYPSADKGMQYTFHDLKQVILANVDLDISTEMELVHYSHQFYPITAWLVAKNRLSIREHNK